MNYTNSNASKIVSFIMLTALLLIGDIGVRAQSSIPKDLPQMILSADVSGFIPFSQSYRLNYETSLIGLPIEFGAQVAFPINASLASSVDLRYRNRKAVFLNDVSISQIEIIPGIRTYLEKHHDNDLRLFASAGLLLARSSISGPIATTHDGQTILTQSVTKLYYNIGLGVGLGLEYEVSTVSAINIGLRLGVYLIDPVSKGGLGDAGGVSIGLGYRYSIF